MPNNRGYVTYEVGTMLYNIGRKSIGWVAHIYKDHDDVIQYIVHWSDGKTYDGSYIEDWVQNWIRLANAK